MSYSEFTLEEVESQFNLIIQEEVKLFESIKPIKPSPLLQETLNYNIPLALDIDTEKARSEMIVAPLLIEIKKIFQNQISIFSGTEFNVDQSKGLNGRCDFIISHSPRQLKLSAPVATLVEAKNDNIKSGIAQCIAEMIASQIFNEQKNNNIPCIYGAVTTGSLWKFMSLKNTTVSLDSSEHFVGDIDSILGIFSEIIRITRPQTN
jgi:hypothetical protein